MGLSVAFELIKKGYKPIIFEADDRIGGMTASFNFNGTNIERFYHFHCKTDHAFFQMLDLLGIRSKFFWTKTKMGFWYKKNLYSWADPIDLLRFPHLNLLEKLRYAVHAYLSTKRNNWKKLDLISAESWLLKSLGRNTYEILWKKLFNLKFYQYTKKVSAAWIWSRIKRTGLSRKNIFTEELGYLEGGSETLLNSLKDFIIKNGGEIHLNSRVESVEIKNKAIKSITVKNKVIQCKSVISTIPIPYINKLIPNLPKSFSSKYKRIKNIGVVCVIVKLKRKISNYFWLNINDDFFDIPGIIEYTNLRKIKNLSIAYVPFYMPQTNSKFKDSDQTFKNKVIKYIQEINPKIKNSDFIDMKVNRYFYSQPICEVQHAKLIPSVSLPVKGLFIADTSFYYPEDRGISESFNYGKKIVNDFF